MQVVVHGTDAPAFVEGPSPLHEAHQAFMDGWLPSMVARGPTLSPDGERHTGSVHVLTVDSLDTARRFAVDEPYARAGWYATVTVRAILPCVDGTMWDRPVGDPDRSSTFAVATWDPLAAQTALDLVRTSLARSPEQWLFAGLVLAADPEPGTGVVGFVGAVDLPPAAALDRLTHLVAPLRLSRPHLEAQRWTRGGRRDA